MSDHDRHPLVQAMAVAGRLPRAEIAAAIEHLAEVTPDLLAAVERAAEGRPEDEAERNLAFFALHILGVAREPGLHGPLMRLLHRPEEEIDELLGDTLTETLDAIIAGAFDGHAEDLFNLARDPERNEFLRSSVMRAITILTWNGRIDAAKTRGFIERFDDDRVIEAGDNGWHAWTCMVEQLGWTDLAPRVEQAYADERVWVLMSSVENFREGLAETLQAAPDDARRFRHGAQGYLEDALRELERYHFDAVEPRPVPPSVPKPRKPVPKPREPAPLRERPRAPQLGHTHAVRNPMHHVGRNDPCPCGSGKKYKKCCLAV
jgi:hypothetical protein